MRKKFVTSVHEEILEFILSVGNEKPLDTWSEFFDIMGYFNPETARAMLASKSDIVLASECVDVAYERFPAIASFAIKVATGAPPLDSNGHLMLSMRQAKDHHWWWGYLYWQNKNMRKGRKPISYNRIREICSAFILRWCESNPDHIVFADLAQVEEVLTLGKRSCLRIPPLKRTRKHTSLPYETRVDIAFGNLKRTSLEAPTLNSPN